MNHNGVALLQGLHHFFVFYMNIYTCISLYSSDDALIDRTISGFVQIVFSVMRSQLLQLWL
jgi:hypothetical protein